MEMSAGAGRMFGGFGGGGASGGHGPGLAGHHVHGGFGHPGPGRSEHGEGPGGRPDHGHGHHGPGGHGHPDFGHGLPGYFGPPDHGLDIPGHEDWDAGPGLARGGFPPHPPLPPLPPGPPGGPGFPGAPGFPGGPGSFGGPGGWGGGAGPFQRVREFRGRGPSRPVRPAVLALLAEEPMHGYQLMQEIRRRTNDRWRPSPGSVYPILQQLEDEGLVRTAETGGRRVAELTDAGREHVAGREAEFAALWAEPEEEPGADRFAALWHALGELSGAAAQVGQSGTDAQVAEVKKILADARRRVYAVLADAGLEDED
ncbi:PadR family transcriptional regulator [Amycolatopsis sp. NPDC048633]|uniref:PadR family transcriptional regulator n=1 Tax=Amycolatopsis sp. NPDC048633 TaxID=3157095 RepID=UPI0033E672D1